MEIFRTPVTVAPSDKKINYISRIMLLGSCFSEHIGQKLADGKFMLNNNPFGIVYNPLSITHQLKKLIDPKDYLSEDLFFHESLWHSFDHHSRFSMAEQESCLKNINQELSMAGEFLKSADFLFLTFGTAYVFYLKKNAQVVSNCHKLPARDFTRELASINHIVDTYKELLSRLFQVNPDIKVVFTVSPVRHWKDGAHGNQISKSTLLIAIDEICREFPQTFYFPSYEIVMDELRDYRFYDEDMIHPSKIAVDYIWQRFTECFLAKDAIPVMKEVDQIIQASKHRPFNPGEQANKDFAKRSLEKIDILKQKYSLDFRKEEAHFREILNLKSKI